jgi:hypothetical protein
VVDVPVRHEQIVEQGEVLAQLSNTDIEVEIADLIGRQRATRERILSNPPGSIGRSPHRASRTRIASRASCWNCAK